MKNIIEGEFGPIYTQFENSPKEAILWLKKQQKGECVNALYREDIGFVDIIWGIAEDSKRNIKGYGLAHIISEHGNEIKQLGFEVEDFIPIIFKLGKIEISNKKTKITLNGETFRLIITTEWFNNPKKILLTAFDLRKIENKNKKRAAEKKKKGRP